MNFKLISKYKPAGDQPKAIAQLFDGLKKKYQHQTLLGITGSGKTFTIANVIEKAQKPTLVIAHNKTLAAQLCNEFREFFPENAVHYFVSYYDYYQPEAYLPRTDTYIEKEAMINEEIDRLRHAATQSLLTRKDVIIVASVSCIYGLGAPENYRKAAVRLEIGQSLVRSDLLHSLVEMQFERTNADLKRGTFRFRGEILEIMPKNQELVYRVELPAQQVSRIFVLDPVTRKIREEVKEILLFPARHFVTLRDELKDALKNIRAELKDRLKYFEKTGKLLEAERLERRTRYDLEMIEQIGFCHGIENYSRPLSGRAPGEPPDTLLNYFPDDFLIVIDESHVTVPQLQGMYEGDASRKKTLIEYGFRLPSAADNRPLRFSEFQKYIKEAIFTSATPGVYEKKVSEQVVEQIIRPTGLIDPQVIVRPITATVIARSLDSNRGDAAISSMRGDRHVPIKSGLAMTGRTQVDDLLERIKEKVKIGDRVLVTTLTKKMAEDLTDFLNETFKKSEFQIFRQRRIRRWRTDSRFKNGKHKKQHPEAIYLHSDIDTLERIRILTDFRKGKFDVLVGVNLLREGLDLPEVSLVAILDADKEGFLRSETSLIQTIGRAARNIRGEVVLYADQMTGSLLRAIGETERRRALQLAYNKEHGITPKTITKKIHDLFEEWNISEGSRRQALGSRNKGKNILDIELEVDKRPTDVIVKEKERQMKEAANMLNFELAAVLRDEIKIMKRSTRGL